MSGDDNEEMLQSIKSSADMGVVADNLLGIADFVIEKHEYQHNCTLSSEVRERAVIGIRKALWSQVDQLTLQRKQILQEMFRDAENALDEVVKEAGE